MHSLVLLIILYIDKTRSSSAESNCSHNWFIYAVKVTKALFSDQTLSLGSTQLTWDHLCYARICTYIFPIKFPIKYTKLAENRNCNLYINSIICPLLQDLLSCGYLSVSNPNIPSTEFLFSCKLPLHARSLETHKPWSLKGIHRNTLRAGRAWGYATFKGLWGLSMEHN